MSAGNAGPDDRQLPTLETELDSSMGSEHRQRIKAMEDSMDKRAKVRGRALIFEQMRMSDKEKFSPKNFTFVKDDNQQKRFKMEASTGEVVYAE